MMCKVALFLFALLMSLSTLADDITLSLEAPTTREDGSRLGPLEILGYELHETYKDVTSVIELDKGLTSYSVPVRGAGVYTFRILAIDTNQLKSKLSDPVSTDILKRSAPAQIELRVKVVCHAGSICYFYEAN